MYIAVRGAQVGFVCLFLCTEWPTRSSFPRHLPPPPIVLWLLRWYVCLLQWMDHGFTLIACDEPGMQVHLSSAHWRGPVQDRGEIVRLLDRAHLHPDALLHAADAQCLRMALPSPTALGAPARGCPHLRGAARAALPRPHALAYAADGRLPCGAHASVGHRWHRKLRVDQLRRSGSRPCVARRPLPEPPATRQYGSGGPRGCGGR